MLRKTFIYLQLCTFAQIHFYFWQSLNTQWSNTASNITEQASFFLIDLSSLHQLQSVDFGRISWPAFSKMYCGNLSECFSRGGSKVQSIFRTANKDRAVMDGRMYYTKRQVATLWSSVHCTGPYQELNSSSCCSFSARLFFRGATLILRLFRQKFSNRSIKWKLR